MIAVGTKYPPQNEIEVDEPVVANLESSEFEARTTEIIRKVFAEEENYYAKLTEREGNAAPIIGGRQSIPQAASAFTLNKNTPVHTDYPFHMIKYIQQLAMWNRHISLAVENIVSLGTTDYEINFGDDTPDQLAEEMRKHCRSRVKNWYEFTEGDNSMDMDLLAQLATTGCISAEAVPMNDLSGIKKIVRVDPYTIRFSYDRATDEFIILQKTDAIGMVSQTLGGYKELKPTTYCYMAMRRFNEFPYAIMPFLSAVEDIIMEHEMMQNFRNMMRRLGMLGFLSVLLTAPKRTTNEIEESYNAKLKNYLETFRPGIEEGFHKGVLVGFKDSHEIDVKSHPNPSSAKDFMDVAHRLIYSGVKQDPAMHGENFSTTESFARVILAKMSKQVDNYQRTLAEFKARCFKLDLMLAGFPVDVVEVEYEPPTISDRKHEAEARKIEIENAKNLYNDGIISQTDRANELGYDEPDEEEPRFNDMVNVSIGEGGAREDETGDSTSTESSSNVSESHLNRHLVKLGGGREEFKYEIPAAYGRATNYVDVTDFDPRMKRFVKSYVNAVDAKFVNAVDKAVTSMHKEVRNMREGTGENTVGTLLKYTLVANWQNDFSAAVVPDVQKHVDIIYDTYRKDQSVFKDASNYTSKVAASKDSFFEIPEPVFTLLDTRAIEYLNAIDQFWLGKFITDSDTISRINRFISNELIGQNLEIGPNSQALHRFIDQFGDNVLEERFKIRRILETTANRARSNANILYLHQAEVKDYEVVEVADTRTCEWCLYMNGMIFSVAPAIQKIQKLTEKDFANLPEIAPFATNIPIEQFTQYSAVELQSMGIDVPSYHPHCRGRVVAKF